MLNSQTVTVENNRNAWGNMLASSCDNKRVRGPYYWLGSLVREVFFLRSSLNQSKATVIERTPLGPGWISTYSCICSCFASLKKPDQCFEVWPWKSNDLVYLFTMKTFIVSGYHIGAELQKFACIFWGICSSIDPSSSLSILFGANKEGPLSFPRLCKSKDGEWTTGPSLWGVF